MNLLNVLTIPIDFLRRSDYSAKADADSMDIEHMRSRFCNPTYVGLGPFAARVVDETWVCAAARMIEKEGSEQFLVNMLMQPIVIIQKLGIRT